jgi:hypothetical protein
MLILVVKYSSYPMGTLMKEVVTMKQQPTFSTKQFSDTDVEEVKRQNANSGLSYNEVFALLGKRYLEREKNK